MTGRARGLIIGLVVVFFMPFFMAAGASAAQMGTVDTSKAHIAKIGKFINGIKSADKSIEEINVHATGKDGNTIKIASTTSGTAGAQSDPEDIDAIIDNQVVVIAEGASLDVTVPMANAAGMPAAVAGITISLAGGITKDTAKAKAVEIAAKIDKILVNK